MPGIAAAPKRVLRLRSYLQIAEIGIGARPHPKCDSSGGVSQFEVFDDETRLRRLVNVELRASTLHDDSVSGPSAGCEIDVRLIDARRLFAQAFPPPLGFGGVLRRMVAPRHIVGSAVGGPQVDDLVLRAAALHAKGDANKAAGRGERARRGFPSELNLDGTVLEGGAF